MQFTRNSKRENLTVSSRTMRYFIYNARLHRRICFSFNKRPVYFMNVGDVFLFHGLLLRINYMRPFVDFGRKAAAAVFVVH